ncbi:MAG TPA: hypothetical protein VKU00_07225 [Chthonomonadaceae bacterium]|nr:hypothetical protein [Chthonomonadaceae bacterium]
MKQNLSPGVIVAVIALVAVVLAYFGWRTLRGGPNADITQDKIKYYAEQKQKRQEHKFSSPQEAAKAGAPMGTAVPVAPSATAPAGPR